MRHPWRLPLGGASLLALVVAAIPCAGVRADDERAAYPIRDRGFDVEVLVGDSPLAQDWEGGRRVVEARRGSEYAVRVRNPLSVRVAVALAVDGLNTIDARRTSARDASLWVIQPYQSITVRGWQTSRETARRFFFTTERDSYAAKLGTSTSDVGTISATFFRERTAYRDIMPRLETDAPRGRERDEAAGARAPSTSTAEARARRDGTYLRAPYDDRAATGSGRIVDFHVQSIHMDLESDPVAEVTVRYDYHYHPAPIHPYPRPQFSPDPDERAFCPEP